MPSFFFDRGKFPIPNVVGFVSLEYHIVQKIIYETLAGFGQRTTGFPALSNGAKVQC
jgi:hypothetical protein